MDTSIKNRLMANPNPENSNTVQLILAFVTNSLPMVVLFGGIWKLISEIAKYYSKKQEAILRNLINDEVDPKLKALTSIMENLTRALNDLREEIGALKKRP
jgi:thioredoxin-related protein